VSTLRFGFQPDAAARAPLYQQLAQALARAISDGQYQTNEALPSERLLCDGLNLSRVTARRAIDELVEQGLVVRRHGAGNYIAPKLVQTLSRLTSFSEELAQRGFVPSSRWLSRGFAPANAATRQQFGLDSAARVARLERQRLADDIVMAYEISQLPEHVLPDPEDVGSSLYAHLERSRNLPTRAVQSLHALNADAHLSAMLCVPEGEALLFITRVGYLESGQPVELSQSYCRSDYYGYVAEMRRDL
jgi:GntR family transcriptional regulator